MHEGSKKVIVAALAANVGIAAAKFVGFALTGAASMLAEAVHSLADSGNQALLMLGAARAKRGATPEHPFGHGGERYFWAFVVAIVLFLLGGVFAIYEGVEKLRHPHALESPLIGVTILTLAIALEGWSFRTALREANLLRGDSSWWGFIRHTKAAELPVVLLEDLAALVGLVLALLGVGLSMLTGDPRLDAAGSIAIGVLLTAVATVLASEMRSLLIGESASPARIAQIEAALLAGPRLRRIIHLRTLHLAPDELLVAVKCEFDRRLSFEELALEIDAAEVRMRAHVPETCVIYIEPDVYRDSMLPATPHG
jgi:cation diffusion facilitator family transporter